MNMLTLKVLDKNDKTICVSHGEDFVNLVCTAEYKEGDRIVLETSGENLYVFLQVDDVVDLTLAVHMSLRVTCSGNAEIVVSALDETD